jgi:site-specific recombinase XerD
MRGFLGFLERQGLSASGLASSVLAPCIYKHERCPRFLTPTEVDRVLGVIDRQTVLGKRDYAMLMLLSRYGLRGIEVVRLQLDHLDWRNQRLHVRHRKAGNNTVYPLGVLVGEAIVAYLRQARPTSTCREVFLRSNAPFAPLTCRTLSSHVRKYLAQAGLQAERAGTHTFRYSCAQRLFEVGMSLKTIGDYLGHSDPNTTQRYTKIALDQLREVAVGDGEDLL